MSSKRLKVLVSSSALLGLIFTALSLPGSEPERPPCWEYRSALVRRNRSSGTESMNELGKQGWELVAVVSSGTSSGSGDFEAFFKRTRPCLL